MAGTIHSTVSMESGGGCVLEVGYGLQRQQLWPVDNWGTVVSVSWILRHKHEMKYTTHST